MITALALVNCGQLEFQLGGDDATHAKSYSPTLLFSHSFAAFTCASVSVTRRGSGSPHRSDWSRSLAHSRASVADLRHTRHSRLNSSVTSLLRLKRVDKPGSCRSTHTPLFGFILAPLSMTPRLMSTMHAPTRVPSRSARRLGASGPLGPLSPRSRTRTPRSRPGDSPEAPPLSQIPRAPETA